MDPGIGRRVDLLAMPPKMLPLPFSRFFTVPKTDHHRRGLRSFVAVELQGIATRDFHFEWSR
jgi:hypothetical protein